MELNSFLIIAMGTFMFSIIVMGLVSIILAARSRLVNTGDVSIIVNDDDSSPILASAGSSLLNTLAEKNIFIPSACGGGGTCVQCKVNVLEGEVICCQLNLPS